MARWDELIARVPLNEPILGAEIGVWNGTMSGNLLVLLPQLTLFLVDRWVPPSPEEAYYKEESDKKKLELSEHNKAFARTMNCIQPFGERAKVLRGDSVEMAGRVGDQSLDFVFVDADHTYFGVSRDLRAWVPKVKPGGLIGGHDYGRPEIGQVKEAVDKYFEEKQVEVSPFYCWWIRK